MASRTIGVSPVGPGLGTSLVVLVFFTWLHASLVKGLANARVSTEELPGRY